MPWNKMHSHRRQANLSRTFSWNKGWVKHRGFAEIHRKKETIAIFGKKSQGNRIDAYRSKHFFWVVGESTLSIIQLPL